MKRHKDTRLVIVCYMLLDAVSCILGGYLYDTDYYAFNNYIDTHTGCNERNGDILKHGIIDWQLPPNGYGQYCWHIVTSKPSFITIRFSDLNFPPLHSNKSFRCRVFDNRLQLSATDIRGQTQTVCSTDIPQPFLFHSSNVSIIAIIPYNYHDSIDISNVRFRLSFSVDETCDKDVHLQFFTNIISPGFPYFVIPDVKCSWNVTLDKNLPLELTYSTWEVYDDSVLSIYDGTSKDDKLLAMMFGAYNNFQSHYRVQSSGPYMYLEFQSRGIERYKDYVKGFNVTIKPKGYCLPGTYSCGGDEGICYSEAEHCDKILDCQNGNDELGCGHCPRDRIWCGEANDNEYECFDVSQRCDGNKDCHSSYADERNCLKCAPGAFLCSSSNTCVFESWLCDGENDCPHHEDEEGCTETLRRRVITAAIVGSLVCGLLLVVALGCSCKLYSLRRAASTRHLRNRFVIRTPLERIARELLQQEAPPSYSMAIDGVEQSDLPRRRSSSSSQRRRERRRRRRRNRETQIRRAQPANAEQVTNRTDTVPADVQGSHTVQTVIRSDSAANSAPATSSSITDDVVCILAEIGLSEIPSGVVSEASNGTQPTSTSAGNTSRPGTSSQVSASESRLDVEPQAKALPSKKKILPVMFEAPFNSVGVGDIAACVYPNPPSYSAALKTDAVTIDHIPVHDDGCTDDVKTSSAPKRLLNKWWGKSKPMKSKDFLKLSAIQSVFSLAPSLNRSGLRSNTSNPHLDEDQIQLISDFADDCSSLDDAEVNLIARASESDYVERRESDDIPSTSSSVEMRTGGNDAKQDVIKAPQDPHEVGSEEESFSPNPYLTHAILTSAEEHLDVQAPAESASLNPDTISDVELLSINDSSFCLALTTQHQSSANDTNIRDVAIKSTRQNTADAQLTDA